ncbi:hypothetical protein [Rhizorhabdus wittichii]|uniref:hypothetical protein n=1 Tax=Rhizorhabdus wittichii TaxID=160791 RepID=UPI0002F31F3F|nr:hypothetical protein [Rhizorhabdus wittichii]
MSAAVLERDTILPENHLPAVRKVIRCADNYRASCTVLEAYEDELRQFRTMQCVVRLSNAEIQMNKRRAELDEAIDALRASFET